MKDLYGVKYIYKKNSIRIHKLVENFQLEKLSYKNGVKLSFFSHKMYIVYYY